MMEIAFSKIKNCKAIDLKISILGILLVLFFDFCLLLKTSSKAIMALVLLSSIILIAFFTYYLMRTKTNNTRVKSITYTNNQYIISSIIFFLFIFLSLVTIKERPTIYERPITFFIFISLSLSSIVIDIFFLPAKKNIVYFTLFKIILVAVILRWIPLSIIPGLYGDDPLYHQMFTSKILENHHIPLDLQYSNFPLMHLMISSTMIVTGMNFKYSSMFSVTSLQAILVTILIYLLAYTISLNYKLGIISSFVYSFSDVPIGFGILGAFPTTFAILLILTIMYLLFKSKGDTITLSVIWRSTSILFIIVIILSHSLSSLFMAFVLLLLYIFNYFYKSIFNSQLELSLSNSLVTLFFVIMLGYWMYKADFIFNQFVHIVFLDDAIRASFSSVGGKKYSQIVPISSYFFTLFGRFILYGLSVIGFLYATSDIKNNYKMIIISVTGILLTLFGGISQILGVGVAPDRLEYYAYFLLIFPSAFGLLYLVNNLKFRYIPLITLVILIMSFFMITNMSSNTDTPIYAKDLTPQRFIEMSELQSINKVLNIVDCNIGSDNDLAYYIRYRYPGNVSILNFYLNEQTQFKGAIIIRENYNERPIYSRGLYKPKDNIYISLQNSTLNKIYSSEALYVFLNKASPRITTRPEPISWNKDINISKANLLFA